MSEVSWWLAPHPSWGVDEGNGKRLLPAVEALADLPIERVIIPHGDAILNDGAARIRAAVAKTRNT